MSAKLGPGKYLCVYIPIDTGEDIPGIDSMAWIMNSFEEAFDSIEEFIMGGDFVADIDCRFEIFDDKLQPVGNRDDFEDMINRAFDAQNGSVGDVEAAWEDPRREPREASSEPKGNFVERKEGDPKDVKFSDIRIEDRR